MMSVSHVVMLCEHAATVLHKMYWNIPNKDRAFNSPDHACTFQQTPLKAGHSSDQCTKGFIISVVNN